MIEKHDLIGENLFDIDRKFREIIFGSKNLHFDIFVTMSKSRDIKYFTKMFYYQNKNVL